MKYYHSLYGYIDTDNIQHPGKYGPSNTNQGIDSTPSLTELHNFSGAGSRIPYYDFQDGKDTGERHFIVRDLGADITEIEKRQVEINEEIEKESKKIADTDILA